MVHPANQAPPADAVRRYHRVDDLLDANKWPDDEVELKRAIHHAREQSSGPLHTLVTIINESFVKHLTDEAAFKIYDVLCAIPSTEDEKLPPRANSEARCVKAAIAILKISNKYHMAVDAATADTHEHVPSTHRLRLPGPAHGTAHPPAPPTSQPTPGSGVTQATQQVLQPAHFDYLLKKTPEQLIIANLKARASKRATLLSTEGAYQVQYLNEEQVIIDGVVYEIQQLSMFKSPALYPPASSTAEARKSGYVDILAAATWAEGGMIFSTSGKQQILLTIANHLGFITNPSVYYEPWGAPSMQIIAAFSRFAQTVANCDILEDLIPVIDQFNNLVVAAGETLGLTRLVLLTALQEGKSPDEAFAKARHGAKNNRRLVPSGRHPLQLATPLSQLCCVATPTEPPPRSQPQSLSQRAGSTATPIPS
jgi:hypothetical protein